MQFSAATARALFNSPQHLNPTARVPLLTYPVASAIFQPMINVTQNAARQLRNLLDAQKQGAGKGLCVQITKGGCSGLHYEMTLDEKKSGGAVVERDGVEFCIDDESAAYLRGATLHC